MDFYQTIAAPAQARFIERKSEFIGYLSPVRTEEEAVAFVSQIRAQHRKATHNVYAYTLREGNILRHSDDGEPQGTAGMPVLDVLLKEGLNDICCVVTRYFGGILLGGGGLVRAYTRGAKEAVDAADILQMRLCKTVQVCISYPLYGTLSHALPTLGVRVLDSQFTDSVCVTLLVTSERYDALEQTLIELTNGQISLAVMTEDYADLPL